VAIILPTYNERQNIQLVVEVLTSCLGELEWEAIFVDDDSPDGTWQQIDRFARQNRRIRLIRRIGRRGLSSACIEGMLATSAPCIAVMDADLQHDATILPAMLDKLRFEALDIVVGTRLGEGGSMGDFSAARVLLSRLGRMVGSTVCSCQPSDPMSGFFLISRDFLQGVVRELHGAGFKLLLDLLASSPTPVRLGEVGYTFGARRFGESKLDVMVGIEYLFMVANKLLGGIVPVQYGIFLLVGCVGLATHAAFLLTLMRFGHVAFLTAQIASTFAAMAENFILNNSVTFRDRRFSGWATFTGAARFVASCSFGAWANIIFARTLWLSGADWYLAGFAGIVLGSVWNLSISSAFTWRSHRPHIHNRNRASRTEEAFGADPEVLR